MPIFFPASERGAKLCTYVIVCAKISLNTRIGHSLFRNSHVTSTLYYFWPHIRGNTIWSYLVCLPNKMRLENLSKLLIGC